MSTDDQQLILVDDQDNLLGYEDRKKCHTEKGIHHRAFLVLLENNSGQVLMQKRKHKLWDNFWDITATTHPLHLEDHDESYAEAAARCLKDEMGIEGIELQNIGGFNYFAQFGENCENEYCAILVGKYNNDVLPNKDSVYEYKWVPKLEFIKNSLDENSSYTPWAILTGKFLEKGSN